jgi:hypothetical protein
MTAFPIIELPDDLASAAAEVPDLQKRLVHFIRAEVSLHRRKQRKRSPEVVHAVKKAMEMAGQMQAAGFKPEQARAEFVTEYIDMMESLSNKP